MAWHAIFMPGGAGKYEALSDDAGNVKHFRGHAAAAHYLAGLADTDKAHFVYSTASETAYTRTGKPYKGVFVLRRERDK